MYVFCLLKLFIFICSFFGIVNCAFLAFKKQSRNSLKKTAYASTFLIGLRFQGYHLNRAFMSLNGGSLKVALTVS